MIQAYNYYLGGYIPKTPAKSSVHKKEELKSLYNSIRNLNRQSPLAMISFSDEKQAYALDVKEMSHEMQAATAEALDPNAGEGIKQLAQGETVNIFNRLLKRSDEFGEENGKPSRPGGELRSLVREFKDELLDCGYEVDEQSFLKAPDLLEEGGLPKDFLTALNMKSKAMSINPLEYVDKKVFSYAFLNNKNNGSVYHESVYSGMLFNSYC